VRRFPQILRNFIILVMIPLSLWSGRITAGCICIDGHFESLCGHGSCCSAARSAEDSGSCSCRKCCRSHGPAHPSCCSTNTDASKLAGCPTPDGSRHCCRPLSLEPIVVADSLALTIDLEFVSFVDVAPPVLLPADVEQAVVVHLMDSGSQRDRLSLIQSLLI